ncbi:MAG TPA: hypothetical protein PL019_08915 [Caldisericia bacterium]|nr:hypothetical protein [Caldisericia bacterium]HPI84706.1 hypothetical protein [Caldisericia bacterium]
MMFVFRSDSPVKFFKVQIGDHMENGEIVPEFQMIEFRDNFFRTKDENLAKAIVKKIKSMPDVEVLVGPERHMPKKKITPSRKYK